MPSTVPAFRTRAERFDDLVLAAVERLEHRWASELEGTEFAVEDVPPSAPAPWESGGVPLGRYFAADAGLPNRIVIYRRPVENRSENARELTAVVEDVVVEQVAALFGINPEELDPRYDEE